ncbi:MAG: HD domain-containing phosphohydrolase [Solirubrobacterales bacterium]
MVLQHEGLSGLRERVSAVLRRWRPSRGSAARSRVAIATNLLPAAILVAAFISIDPRSDWSRPELLAALAAIGTLALLAEVRLTRAGAGTYFDSTIVLALIALAIGGPLPALVVWLIPDLISRFVLRLDPRFSPGQVATVTSYGFALLAGEGILALADAPSATSQAPALYTVGLAMLAANFAVARLAYAPFYQGISPNSVVHTELLPLIPGMLVMILIGVATELLLAPLGVLALVLLAGVILLPQALVNRLAEARSIAALDRAEATRIYAGALADALALPRRERRLVGCAARLPPIDRRPDGDSLRGYSLAEILDAKVAGLHLDERWDGGGSPAGLPAEAIPQASRILAVARSWSALTAGDTAELPHGEAMLALAAQAGGQLDPHIVAAAAEIVADEEAFVPDPRFEPKLHRLPLPRPIRRVALPAVLPSISELG